MGKVFPVFKGVLDTEKDFGWLDILMTELDIYDDIVYGI